MSKVQTDNSYFDEKVLLRIETVNNINKNEINVLDAFSGDGLIWNRVKSITDKKINVLRIDEKQDKKGIYLKGNNLKFINRLDLQFFDIIDLDAYGSPYNQLKLIFKKKYKGIVHCTFIQSGMGRIDNGLLLEIGYEKKMIDKAQTLFSRNGMLKMERYLAKKSVDKIIGYFIDRKNYFYFKLS